MLKRIFFIHTDRGLFCIESTSCAAAQTAVIDAGGGSPLRADVLESLSKERAQDLAKRARFIGDRSDQASAQLAAAADTKSGQVQATPDDIKALIARS